jgi:FixJ family two-component response regulator
MNRQEIHVFFVDDESALRMTVQRTLASAGMQVDVFARAEDCLAALPERRCDVVVTDFRMEGMDGLALLREIRRRFPWLRVIIVTAYGDIPSAVAAMRAGATNFLEKPLDREELLSAIKNAFDPAARPVSFPRGELSYAESQVLRLFLEGRTSRETAVALNRSTRTVEAHRYNIMRKFGVHNAVQLAQRASALWPEECRFGQVPDPLKGEHDPPQPHTATDEGA